VIRIRILIVLLAILALAQPGGAQDALAIVKKADEAFAVKRAYSVSKMTVYRSGKARPTMVMETYTMEKNDREHSLSVYKEPARMRGTAYLMIGDDLWVKFSSTGRTRKLSSSAKKNSAGGTDFSYFDMGESSQGLSVKYELTMADRNAVLDGEKCYKIVFSPKPGLGAPYEKLVAYIAKENYRYLKIDYFEAGANIKSLTLSDYRDVDGKDYPYKMIMESHTRPSRTEMVTSMVEFNSSRVKDNYFTVSYLEKIK